MPRILPRPPWKVLRGSKMPAQMGPVKMSLRAEPEGVVQIPGSLLISLSLWKGPFDILASQDDDSLLDSGPSNGGLS